MTYEDDAKSAAERRAAGDWNCADYLGDDEIAGLEAEKPPFGSERHRFLSTIRQLRAK